MTSRGGSRKAGVRSPAPAGGGRRGANIPLLAAVLVAAVLGAAWWLISVRSSPGGTLGSLPAGSAKADLNLLIVTLDTTRADRLGCYGSREGLTPRLDRLAQRGALFANAVSPMPLTLPAHCSLFTGRFPGAHTVRDNGGFKLPAEAVTLAEVLKERGYSTGGFVAAYVLDHKWGISQGFDRYFDDFDLKAQKSVSMGDIQRRGDEVVAKAFAWLDEVKDKRFFAWIHLYDPHAPYAPPEPFATRYAARPYNGEIAWTDSLVGQILDRLDSMGVTKRTIVAVLADHGESLGEHGENGHGFFVYEQVTHVPLIIASPYPGMVGRRVDEVVRTVDVAPTLLEMMGHPGALTEARGRSLVAAIASAPAQTEPRTQGDERGPGQDIATDGPGTIGSDASGRKEGYSESYYARFHFGWSELRAVRTKRWHFIEAPRPELYDLASDPGELTNLAASRSDVVGVLRTALGDYEKDTAARKGATAPVEEDEETLRKLAALGYVGAARPQDSDRPFHELPDPKDRIAIYNLMNRAREEIQSEQDDLARQALEEVLRQAPEVIDAYFMLGNLQLKKHAWAQAADFYRRTLEKRPDHDYAMIGLADTLVATGKVDDAVLGYERFLDQDPDNAQITYRLAQVLLDDGRDAKAADYFRRTLGAEPRTARAEVGLAVVAFRNQDFAGARAAIDRALAIDPKARHARYNLALVQETAGDQQAAVTAYRAELVDYPGDTKAHFNLGRLLGRMGDHRGEIDELRRATETSPEFATGRFFLAQALLASGDLAAARAEATRGLALEPDSAFAPLGHYVLADILAREGRARESEAEVRRGKALESRPRPPGRRPDDPTD